MIFRKQNYQALLDKSFSIGMAADLEQKQKGERFTVLDPAQVPQKHVNTESKGTDSPFRLGCIRAFDSLGAG